MPDLNLLNRHTGCNFNVIIDYVEILGNFSSVSGLTEEIEYEEYNEGGNYISPIYLPKQVKYSNIVLQRGTVTVDPLINWFTDVRDGIFLRYPMTITMMNESFIPVKIWMVMDAMPVKVEYTPLDAMSNSVFTTTVEFVHGEIIHIL